MIVIWARKAEMRLERIHAFIAEDHPGNARKWVEKIVSRAKTLAHTPGIGRIVSVEGTEPVRDLIIGNYRLVYRISSETVTILTIRNFKQKLPKSDLS